MSNESAHAHRKDEHMALAKHFYSDTLTNDFDGVNLLHNSLPELSVAEVDLTTTLFGHLLAAPIYINAMTGGSSRSRIVNQKLAQIAAALNIPMAVGSESIALKQDSDAAVRESFTVIREQNPDGLVFANLSAGKDLATYQAAVDLISADALQIHLNPIQEIIMPEGDRDFHWRRSIEDAVKHLKVPVIVKEVGFGMDEVTLSQLLDSKVSYIDVSGKGGTNFAQIENARRPTHDFDYLENLGISTVESLLEAYNFTGRAHFFASGGIRNPLDIIKAWRMGAEMVGISGTLLHMVQTKEVAEVIATLKEWLSQIRLLMCVFGAPNLQALRQVPIVLSSDLMNYLGQRRPEQP